ncbi:MAG: response regulator transcription factor [Cyclobacteriaceae bacterium]|nr:response regulator transcription factor [Cyclobacteriaceae bacterium]
MNVTHTLIVDDHTIFRKSLIRLLSTFELNLHFYEAANGVEALEVLKLNHIHLALIDIQMPKMNGIDLLKLAKENYPATRAIILTQFDDPSLIVHLIRLGADGFLLKECDPEELVLTIRQVLHEGHYFNKLVSDTLDYALKKGTKTLANLNITPREYQLAELLRNGLSNKEIAVCLGLTSTTVESYRKSLMEKTNCSNLADLLKLLYSTGLVSK